MDGKVVIGTELDTKSFDAQIAEVERELQFLEKTADDSNLPKEFRRSKEEAQKLQAEIEKTRNKLVDLRDKQRSLEQSGIKGAIDNINKGLSASVKKAVRWGLAIFGVRSAYMAIRSAMNTLSQYDSQLAGNLKYIQFALANALKPVIEWILNAVVKILQYINYIANAWFKINLFSSAKDFKDMEESANGTANSAKEIRKQLAGFDEMNVLNDSSSGTTDTGGVTAPSFDLSGIQGEAPAWLRWIADNKDTLLAAFAGVAAGLVAWKLGFKGLQSLGIGLAIAGVVYSIESIIAYLHDTSWENFGGFLQGIAIAVLGIAIAFGAWPVAAAAAMAFVLATIIKYWDKIKEFLQGGIDWLSNQSEWVHNMFGDTIGNIYDNFVNCLQLALNWFDTLFTSFKKIFDAIIQFFKAVFTGNWSEAWNALKTIVFTILEIILARFKFIFGIIKNVAISVVQGIVGALKGLCQGAINGILGGIEGFLNVFIDGVNALARGINLIPGVDIPQINRIRIDRVRLAKGGIINQPGRGIPVGGAIGGERGPEGVIPLTDSQQMELLGQAIGKYITINANITNTMNGRVISRELQKVNNASDFAFNR